MKRLLLAGLAVLSLSGMAFAAVDVLEVNEPQVADVGMELNAGAPAVDSIDVLEVELADVVSVGCELRCDPVAVLSSHGANCALMAQGYGGVASGLLGLGGAHTKVPIV